MFFESLKHIIWKTLEKTMPTILYRLESRAIIHFCPDMFVVPISYRRFLEKESATDFHEIL